MVTTWRNGTVKIVLEPEENDNLQRLGVALYRELKQSLPKAFPEHPAAVQLLERSILSAEFTARGSNELQTANVLLLDEFAQECRLESDTASKVHEVAENIRNIMRHATAPTPTSP